MKNLLLMTALATLSCTSLANAGSVTVGQITATQISAKDTKTFDDDMVGQTSGFSSTCGSNGGYCGPIEFAVDGTVANGTTNGVDAEPANDHSNFLWDVYSGTIWFGSAANPIATTSFDIYWGSIDGYGVGNLANNNTICLSNGSCINGADLVPANNPAAAALNPVVNGSGNQFDINDNQWFRISSDTPFTSFAFYSQTNAFEFDMPATPEASTWVMMLLGLAGLGYAASRRAPRTRAFLA